MKATLKAQITKIEITEVDDLIISRDVKIHFKAKGQVESKNINGRDATIDGILILKPIIANDLKIGSNITIKIDTDSSE